MQKQNQSGITIQLEVSVVYLVFIHFLLWFIYSKWFNTWLALDYQPPVTLYYDLLSLLLIFTLDLTKISNLAPRPITLHEGPSRSNGSTF